MEKTKIKNEYIEICRKEYFTGKGTLYCELQQGHKSPHECTVWWKA